MQSSCSKGFSWFTRISTEYFLVTAFSAEDQKYNIVYRPQLGLKAAKRFTQQVLQQSEQSYSSLHGLSLLQLHYRQEAWILHQTKLSGRVQKLNTASKQHLRALF